MEGALSECSPAVRSGNVLFTWTQLRGELQDTLKSGKTITHMF